jgi:hypothetical protein
MRAVPSWGRRWERRKKKRTPIPTTLRTLAVATTKRWRVDASLEPSLPPERHRPCGCGGGSDGGECLCEKRKNRCLARTFFLVERRKTPTHCLANVFWHVSQVYGRSRVSAEKKDLRLFSFSFPSQPRASPWSREKRRRRETAREGTHGYARVVEGVRACESSCLWERKRTL